jgi:tetrahydromethanopterin S-methyltransferase subunit F
MLGLRIWVIGPVKYATRQVDELVEGIRNNRGDITRRIRVKSGDEVGRLSMAINDLVAQMQTIIRAITESCGHMEEKQTGIISNVDRGGHHPEAGSDGWWHAVCHGGYRRGATGYRGAGYHGGEHAGGGTGWTQLCGGYQG